MEVLFRENSKSSSSFKGDPGERETEEGFQMGYKKAQNFWAFESKAIQKNQRRDLEVPRELEELQQTERQVLSI